MTPHNHSDIVSADRSAPPSGATPRRATGALVKDMNTTAGILCPATVFNDKSLLDCLDKGIAVVYKS